MPNASRACGDKIWWTGVRGGFFLAAGFLRAGAFREEPFRVDDARDDERREGEVFVAIGP
jgi:hypothetical protein